VQKGKLKMAIISVLVLNWDNFLLGCGICNGSLFKGDKFPSTSDGGHLVNPTSENPNDFFDFEYAKEERLANVIPKNTRGTITEQTLGLNRPALVKHKYQDSNKRQILTQEFCIVISIFYRAMQRIVL
jgi:hypothetical protein